jgi:hypothetical protein
MSPAHETQSMREIRLLRGRLPRKGGGLTGMVFLDTNNNSLMIFKKSNVIVFCVFSDLR